MRIEDICGELEYLLDSPILMAEEVAGESGMDEASMTHYTWTFYKFATRKGYITLRWLGTSNGYYGEEVSLIPGSAGKSHKGGAAEGDAFGQRSG